MEVLQMLASDNQADVASVLRRLPSNLQKAVVSTITNLEAKGYYWESFLLGDVRTAEQKREDALRLQPKLRRACSTVQHFLLTGESETANASQPHSSPTADQPPADSSA